MITYLIVQVGLALAAVVLFVKAERTKGDPTPWCLTGIACAIFAITAFPLFDTYHERKAFDAITACEAKRMEARRQVLSSRVVCIPAYRATKSDTLTVQTPDLKETP